MLLQGHEKVNQLLWLVSMGLVCTTNRSLKFRQDSKEGRAIFCKIMTPTSSKQKLDPMDTLRTYLMILYIYKREDNGINF